MSNYNKIILIGNLTKDWEIKQFEGGNCVASGSIAVNEARIDKDGNKIETTLFVDLTAWGKLAETLSKYTKRGSSILIDGKLKLEDWLDKETGAKRSKHSVTVTNMQFLGAAPSKDPEAKPYEAPERPQQQRASHLPPSNPVRQQAANQQEDEIPF